MCVDAVSVGPPVEGAVGRGPCVGRVRSRAGSLGAGERDPCRFPCVQILLVSRVVCCDSFTHGYKPNLRVLLSWFTVCCVLSYGKKESLAFPVGVCSFCFWRPRSGPARAAFPSAHRTVSGISSGRCAGGGGAGFAQLLFTRKGWRSPASTLNSTFPECKSLR